MLTEIKLALRQLAKSPGFTVIAVSTVALAIGAGGALSAFETTVLLTVEETIDALRKAGQVRYRPPGA